MSALFVSKHLELETQWLIGLCLSEGVDILDLCDPLKVFTITRFLNTEVQQANKFSFNGRLISEIGDQYSYSRRELLIT